MVSNRFISERAERDWQKNSPPNNIFNNHFTYFAVRKENASQHKITERQTARQQTVAKGTQEANNK